jgi:hypothetical protein
MSSPVKVITVMRRESVSQPWYESTPEFTEYFRNTYVNTGKVLLRRVRESANQLVKKKIVVWANFAEKEAYMADPLVVAEIQRQQSFFENNNIRSNTKNKIVV